MLSRVSSDAFAGAGLGIVGEQQVVGVAELPGDRLRVRVEQQLGVVEAQPPLGPVLAADLVAVQLPGSDALDMGVPDEPVALGQLDDVGRVAVSLVEQQQEHVGGVLRVDGEVHAVRASA